MNIKLTPTQQLLLSALLSMIGSALIAGTTVAYQSSHGSVDVGTTLNVALATFLVFFGKSLYDYVPGHATQLIQALQDTMQEMRKAPVQGPLVVVHTTTTQAQLPQIETLQPAAAPIMLTHSDIPTPVQQAATVTTEAPQNAASLPLPATQEDDTKPLAAVHAERAAQK